MVQSDALDLDEMYKIAANERRRLLVQILMDTGATLAVGELSRQLVERDSTAVEGIDDRVVRTELDHWHLPMLGDAGFVEFDRERGIVRPQGEIHSFDAILPDSEG